MKKLLALVLTLVMTMSLMTVSNAATFSDDASIDYKEAVEVMAAVGVLAGDGTGAFDADGKLTRAAAAKIVTYLMIGAEAAEGLAGSAVFTDVPADHWAAGYISYLVTEGVVAGIGDGKFDPNGELTALQFAKMLLVALGYDAAIEKLTGESWSISTSKLAYAKNLFDGNDGVKVNSVATRQEAALYAFNALKAVWVKYDDKGTNVNLGDGVSVIVSAKAAKENGESSGFVAFNSDYSKGEALFEKLYGNDLRPESKANGYGYPATTWTYKATEVGTYTAAPVVTFTTAFTPNEMLDAVKAAGYAFDDYKNTGDAAVYNASIDVVGNGAAKTIVYDGTYSASTLDPDMTAALLKTNVKMDFGWTGNGVRVDFFANSDNFINKIVVTTPVLAKVTSVKQDNTSTLTVDERQINLEGGYSIVAKDEVAGFEDIFATVEKDDMLVLLAKADKTVLKVYAPKVVAGTASFVGELKATVGGTSYETYNGKKIGTDLTTIYAGKDAELLLDEYGYILSTDGVGSDDQSLMILEKYQGTGADGKLADMAYVVYGDGTTAIITLEAADAGDSSYVGYPSASTGKVYKYDDANNNSKIELVEATAKVGALSDTDAGKVYLANEASIDEASKGVNLGTGRAYFAAGAKIINVSGDDTNGWKFTVSDKLTADITSAIAKKSAVVLDEDGYISTMYINGAAAKNSIKDGSALIFVAGATGTAVGQDKDGKEVNLTVYDAYIDGVKVENFMAETAVGITVGFYNNEYDTDKGCYILANNQFEEGDIQTFNKTVSVAQLEAAADKYVVDAGNSNAEVDIDNSGVKYAANLVSEEEINSYAEMKYLMNEEETNKTATIHVAYDKETSLALYVYVIAIGAALS